MEKAESPHRTLTPRRLEVLARRMLRNHKRAVEAQRKLDAARKIWENTHDSLTPDEWKALCDHLDWSDTATFRDGLC